MKKLFFDTNVLIDFLADRAPYSQSAAQLFEFALKRKLRIYVSAISFNNIYYIIRQNSNHSEALKLLTQLKELVEVIAVDSNIIEKALTSGFNDFEDGLQYISARNTTGIDAIVTRDIKGYKKSEHQVLSPDEALVTFINAGR